MHSTHMDDVRDFGENKKTPQGTFKVTLTMGVRLGNTC